MAHVTGHLSMVPMTARCDWCRAVDLTEDQAHTLPKHVGPLLLCSVHSAELDRITHGAIDV